MRLTIVDVFAEARYQGNQLAVVQDAADLDSATMQAIAREMNFSETTFVTDRSDIDVAGSAARARVRIFTPAEELPFAGHPTLGTAWVLGRSRPGFTLTLPVGDVAVRFVDGIAWMTPPPATAGPALDRERAAALIGLVPGDLDPDLEPRILRCGPAFPIVPVRDLERLRQVRVERPVQQRLGIEGFPFCVCRGGYSADADFAARMLFFDGVGMREDPATGAANAAFASYLRDAGMAGDFIVEQGFEVLRPSRIHLQVADRLAVGGRVRAVAEGRLLDGV